jgi:hypothetical protein
MRWSIARGDQRRSIGQQVVARNKYSQALLINGVDDGRRTKLFAQRRQRE